MRIVDIVWIVGFVSLVCDSVGEGTSGWVARGFEFLCTPARIRTLARLRIRSVVPT